MQKKAKEINPDAQGLKVLSALTDRQWVDLLNSLSLFTKRRYYNVDAQDLISEAVTAVIEGRRCWDLRKSPFHNLCLIVRSVASNQLAKEKPFINTPAGEDLSPTCTDLTSPARPLQVEIFEQRETDQRFYDRLRQALGEDSLLHRIVDYLIAIPHWKPQKIAHDLKVEKKEVNNARKRLIRALGHLREDQEETP